MTEIYAISADRVGSISGMRRMFVRSLIVAFVGFAALFALEFFLEWRRAGYPGHSAMSWAGSNNGKLADVLSPMARAYNNVLAMLLATIGLAIPLTANMHTPKLIDMFLRDPINRIVLTFMALGAAHVLWVVYLIGPEFAPTWAASIAVYLAIAGWIILIPYFFYVVRFLDPSRIIVRLGATIRHDLAAVAAGKADPVKTQETVALTISHLDTIIIKSLERDDREVAREGIWLLKRLIDDYAALKPKMPRGWYRVDRADFVGFSAEALDMLTDARTWFEMKCMKGMEHAYERALSEASDAVSAISDANRLIATGALERGDTELLNLSMRFFNNFVREAIKTRHLRGVYDVFHQYRLLGKDLGERPDLLRQLGRSFTYYGVMARTYGMVFAPQLAVFDLGYVTRRAYEARSAAAPDLLQMVLSMPHETGGDVHSLAVKAKLILGSFLLSTKQDAEAQRVAANLDEVDADEIRRARDDLLAADRVFFEVTDRQLNLEWIPPERREPLTRFCARLLDEDPAVSTADLERQAEANRSGRLPRVVRDDGPAGAGEPESG
jgi:hypothetical protein